MRDQSPGLVTLIFLALGGFLIPQVAGSRSAGKKELSAAPAAKPGGKLLKQGGDKRSPTDEQKKVEGQEGPKEGAKDAFDLLAEFLGRPQHHIAFTEDRYDAGAALRRVANLLDGTDFKVQAITVTVPDPVDSILDYTFDRHIDAIQRAQQKMGFVIDRYWLPWEKQRKRAPQSGPPAFTDEEKEDVNPGVMLFRNFTEHKQLIERKLSVVFLVPETPASGLHKNSLRKALLDTLVLRTVTGDKGPVRIMGPFFSGSALSLRLGLLSLLRDERTFGAQALNVDRPLRVDIVSGSATNFANKKILEEFDPGANVARELPVNVTFKATVLPDSVTKHVLYRYLKRSGIDVVAELTESGTSYGQSLADRPPRPDLDLPEVLTIRFPINISQVRAASERNRALQAAQAAPVTESSPSSIELSLDETAKPLDVVPALSAISPASEELVLSALLSTIAHHQISAVGIFATDVRDKLFLGRQVALNCPGVTLFTLDGDVLFAHPQYVQYFRGMLIASTYPLYNRNQNWTSPGGRDLSQFASSPAEGSFNAFLALSGGDRWLTEYSTPFLRFKSVMYKEPSLASGTRPPAWLSVIGSHSVWPLDVVLEYGSYRDALDYLYTPRPTAADHVNSSSEASSHGPVRSLRFHAPLESSFVFVLLSILALACSVALLYTNQRQVRKQPWSLGAPFHIDLSSPARPRKHMGLFLFSAASAIVYVHAAGLYFLPVRFAAHAPDAADPPGWVGPAAAGVVLVLTLSAVALLAWLGFRREFQLLSRTWRIFLRLGPARRRNAARWRVWFRRVFEHLSVAAASVTILLALIETVVAAVRPLDAASLFFFDRAVNPASGLSISLPIFLVGLAFAFLGFCHLWRLTLSESCPISSSLGGSGHAILASIERRIRARILGVWVKPESALLVAISFAIPLSFLARMLKTPVDDVTFVWLFRFALFFVCLGILTSAVRFLSLWHELHTFLRHIACLPLTEAIKRLPDRFSGVVGLKLNSRGLDDADTETILDAGNSLLGQLGGAASQLTALSGLSAASLLNVGSRLEALAPYRVLPRRSRSAYGALRDAAASVFIAIDGKSAPASTNGPAAAAWFLSAEEFVAFQIVAFVSYVCEHLRNLLTAFLAPSFLLFLSLVLYPFQPARILLGFMFVFVSVLAILTVRMLAQMERDEILSLISRTAPGKVTWDFSFVSRVLIYGVFPILSLLAANIPDVQALLAAGIVNVSRLLH
jgi:hypothetical protein